jgi:hypothetical protein
VAYSPGRRKKSDPGATKKTDGTFHAKLLVLDCWLVNSVFQKYDFGLLLSSYFRSDVWHLELKSKGVIEIDQW